MRGKVPECCAPSIELGTTPHERGEEGARLMSFEHTGINPASAGKRLANEYVAANIPDQPRECGEKTSRPAGLPHNYPVFVELCLYPNLRMPQQQLLNRHVPFLLWSAKINWQVNSPASFTACHPIPLPCCPSWFPFMCRVLRVSCPHWVTVAGAAGVVGGTATDSLCHFGIVKGDSRCNSTDTRFCGRVDYHKMKRR